MNFSRKAAGEDLVVDTTDISDLANSDPTYVEKAFNKIETGSLVGSDDWNHEEMMNLMGLKKFLQEFTFIKERGMVEVNLWNEYLVYALLFGISEKVMKDFKETCPEYFKMSDFGMQIEEITAAGGIGGLASLLSTYGRSSYNSGAVVVAVLRGAAVEVSAAEAEVAVVCAELGAIVDDDVGKSLRVVIGIDVVGEVNHTHLGGCHKIAVNPVDTDTI